MRFSAGFLRALALPLVLASCVSCARARSEPAHGTIRLVGLFKPEMVSGTVTATETRVPRTEWRFDKAAPAVADVDGAAVRDGRFAGRATSDFPMFSVERTSDLDNRDQVHAVEIRMRASAGANVSLTSQPSGVVDFADLARRAGGVPWAMSSPILPGTDVQTYTITPQFPLNMSRLRHLVIRPTDASGATFDVESVRIVTRREHLASLASGVAWQGLGESYRETLVGRAPETMRFDVDVPARGWLDLAVGTVEEQPITFRVGLLEGKDDRALLEHTMTTAFRWDRRSVDLSSFAGRRVSLVLSLRSDRPGTIGFWGSPVIRSRVTPGGDTPLGVIFVHADTLRADHLDAYGYERETGPNIGRMAREGALFKFAMSQAGWTKVSTPSFLTGLYPSTTGVFSFPDRLPVSATTIAEVYQAAGYATASFSSNGFIGVSSNMHQGYEEFHEPASLTDSAPPYTSKTARENIERAAQWIEQHRDTPFFVFVHLNDPHAPYEPRPPFNTMWADPARRDEHVKQRESLRKTIKDASMAARGMATREEMLAAGIDPAAYIAYDLAWYDGSIRGLDTEMGRLLERLQGLGIDRDVAIAFLGDHGEEFHEHGRMWHEHSAYGEMLHVPLIIRWPAGVAAGRVIEDPVHLLDVMPTLLDFGRLPKPKEIQGQSLAPLVLTAGDAASWRRRPVIMEKQPLARGFPSSLEAYAIIDGNWKLVYNKVREPERPEYELFEFPKDRLDQKNVAAEHPDVVARLSKLLNGWHGMATAARLKPDAELTKTMSAEELRRLRSLGYVK
jgi:arylsulfatase A-like enzyme